MQTQQLEAPEEVSRPVLAGSQAPEVSKRPTDDETILLLTMEIDAIIKDRDAIMKDRDAHCIIPSARLVIQCNPCTDPDTPESKLLNAAFRIANGLLRNPVVHNSLIEVGVSAAVLNKESLKVVFEDPYETFADDESPYACAWIDPKKHGAYTIVADLNLLKRYEKIWNKPGDAAEKERRRIEFFIGWKIAFQGLGKLGFRWKNPKYMYLRIPKGVFGVMSGPFVEKQVGGGEFGIIHGAPKRWGGQEISGIHVKGRRVREQYIERVCNECRLEEPNFKSLLPVKACCAPFKRSRGQYMLLTAASFSESDDDALDAADAQSVPCGKNQFMIRGNGCGLRFWPKPGALRPAVSAPPEEATARLRKRPSPDGPERAAPAAARLRADA